MSHLCVLTFCCRSIVLGLHQASLECQFPMLTLRWDTDFS